MAGVATIPFTTELPNGTLLTDAVNRQNVDVKRVILKQKAGGSDIILEFPFGPTEVAFDTYGLSYNQINRPDLKPMLVNSGPELRTISFDAFIADRPSAAKANIQSFLNDVETLVSEDIDCEFIYGLYAIDYPVRVTRSSMVVTQRDASGAPLKATLSFQLTEAIEIPDYGTTLLPVIGANASATSPTILSGSGVGGGGSAAPDTGGNDSNYVPVCEASSSTNPECGYLWYSFDDEIEAQQQFGSPTDSVVFSGGGAGGSGGTFS